MVLQDLRHMHFNGKHQRWVWKCFSGVKKKKLELQLGFEPRNVFIPDEIQYLKDPALNV